MSLLRNERVTAILLAAAAAAGLAIANSPAGPAVIGAVGFEFGPGPWHLSIAEWVQDGLLAVFFLVAAIELRHELTRGALSSPHRALRPAVAAAGGVVVPIAIYLAFTAGSGQEGGWPIPTATDIAFALGLLGIFGRGLPSGVRAFLLALAILDDIAGILFIAFAFSHGVEPVALVVAALAVAAWAVLGAWRTRVRGVRIAIVVGMTACAIVAWGATCASGVHPTIAGVALGLTLSPDPARRLRHAIEPAVNGLVLPLFAFTASLVAIPAVPAGGLAPAFWGIAVGLPVGKLLGIVGAAWIVDRLATRDRAHRIGLRDLLLAGALGGIGFTVSLLMASLAFAGDPALSAEATLAVLAGSAVAVVLASAAFAVRGARR